MAIVEGRLLIWRRLLNQQPSIQIDNPNRQSQSSIATLNRQFAIRKSALTNPQSAIDLADDQLPFHASAALVGGEVAVEAVSANLICAELEDDGLAGRRALGDAVLVDREAVRDVLCGEGDLDQIVLLHFDAHRLEGELIAGDREFARRPLCRGLRCERRRTDHERAADEQRRQDRALRDADHWAPRLAGPTRPCGRVEVKNKTWGRAVWFGARAFSFSELLFLIGGWAVRR